jgi:hypothetical protein
MLVGASVILCVGAAAGQSTVGGSNAQSQAQQGLCNEKCVMTLDDEGLPHGSGCVLIHDPNDPARGEECLASSSLPLGQCEIDQGCQSGGFAFVTEGGEQLLAGEGCQRSAAVLVAAGLLSTVREAESGRTSSVSAATT